MQNLQGNISDKVIDITRIGNIPLVSFIIPYYNTPKEWLQRCVESITSLSLKDNEREIIIVDDGSDVEIESDLLKYGNTVRYIRQNNGGPGSARNAGLKVSSGQYIQFVDSDDELDVNNYNKCLDIIKQNKPDMLLFRFHYEQGDNSRHSVIKHTDGVTYMSKHNIMGMPWWYIFKRSILGNILFTEGIYHEDEEFNPQLLINASILYVTDIKAYIYNRHSDSITTSTSSKNIKKRLDDKHAVICRLRAISNSLPIKAKEAMSRRIAQLTMDYIYNIITDTRSLEQLNSRLSILRSEGFFPLPPKRYTNKYTMFRYATNNSIGRYLLVKIIPKIKE